MLKIFGKSEKREKYRNPSVNSHTSIEKKKYYKDIAIKNHQIKPKHLTHWLWCWEDKIGAKSMNCTLLAMTIKTHALESISVELCSLLLQHWRKLRDTQWAERALFTISKKYISCFGKVFSFLNLGHFFKQ